MRLLQFPYAPPAAGQALVATGAGYQTTWTPQMTLQATTGIGGFALVNGTPNIVSWTAPNDGQMHRFICTSVLHVTSSETGGSVQLQWMLPDGTSDTNNLYGASLGTGVLISPAAGSFMQVIAPGTTVKIVQLSALTAGAAMLWAEIWGS